MSNTDCGMRFKSLIMKAICKDNKTVRVVTRGMATGRFNEAYRQLLWYSPEVENTASMTAFQTAAANGQSGVF